jgi:transposase
MMIMPAQRKYPQELRERSMRLVAEARKDDPELSLNQAVVRIGQRVGIVPDTLRGWVKQAAIDAGERPGTTTDDAKRIKDLEAENRELKRANEILLAASSFFAREPARDCRGSGLHRRPQGPVRGLVRLPRAHRARLHDRPVDVLRRQNAGPPPPGRCAIWS